MDALSLHIITDANDSVFPAFWEIYETSFPAEERRSLSALRPLLKCESMTALAAKDGNRVVGVAVYWCLAGFVFLEHIAIDGKIRGGGYGGNLLSLLQDSFSLPILLEVEIPSTDESVRRIKFYEKHHYTAYSNFAYEQPPYDRIKPAVPMVLMSNVHDFSDDQLADMASIIRKEVYERNC